MNQQRHRARPLAISLFLPTVGIAVPFVHLSLLNTANLTLPLTSHLPELAAICGLVAAVVWGLLTILPGRWRHAGMAITLAVGMVLWAEATLLIGNYGFLTGADLDWQANRHLVLLEVALAALLIVVLARLHRQLVARAGWIMLILLASSLANLVGPLLQAVRGGPPHSPYTFTSEGLFRLSPARNVLLIIVDTFQSDVFATIAADDPRWQDRLDGFTYFPDAISSFPKTYTSVPSLLTGRSFDNSQPFPEYLRRAYLGDSLPRVLKRQGYDVRYRSFTWQPYLADPRVADNITAPRAGQSARWMERQERTQLLNLLLFRLTPHAGKRWAYNDGQFRLRVPGRDDDGDGRGSSDELLPEQRVHSRGNLSADLAFLDRTLTFLTADSPRPTLRIWHLNGVHQPFVLDRTMAYVARREPEAGAIRDQSEAMLVLLDLVFARLRDLGLYDESLIMVVGDHGGGEFFSLEVQGDGLRRLGVAKDVSSGADAHLQEIVRGGIPLVLAKPPRASGKLAISTAPVTLNDIPATVFDLLDLDVRGAGESFFRIDPDRPRPRLHRFYRFAGWGQDFIVPMKEFQVTGFSWDPASWQPTGRDLNRTAVRSAPGTLVVPALGGNLDDFAHGGWSDALLQGRQISDDGAYVTLPLGRLQPPLAVEATITQTYLPTEPSPLSLLANDRLLATWTMTGVEPLDLVCQLPPHLVDAAGEVTLGFRLGPRRTAEPVVVDLRLVPGRDPAELELGHAMEFGVGGNAAEYQEVGWGGAEPWGAWVEGFAGSLRLRLAGEAPGGLELQAELLAAVAPGGPPVTGRVLVNQAEVGRVHLEGREIQVRRWTIPGELLRSSGQMEVMFLMEDPRAGAGASRAVGLGVSRLVLHAVPGTLPGRFRPVVE